MTSTESSGVTIGQGITIPGTSFKPAPGRIKKRYLLGEGKAQVSGEFSLQMSNVILKIGYQKYIIIT